MSVRLSLSGDWWIYHSISHCKALRLVGRSRDFKIVINEHPLTARGYTFASVAISSGSACAELCSQHHCLGDTCRGSGGPKRGEACAMALLVSSVVLGDIANAQLEWDVQHKHACKSLSHTSEVLTSPIVKSKWAFNVFTTSPACDAYLVLSRVLIILCCSRSYSVVAAGVKVFVL